MDPLQLLEKAGSINFLNKQIGPAGSFMADVLIDGVLFERKSYFPSSWDYKTTVEKIFESFNAISKQSLQPNGSLLIEGVTSEGITIRSIITPHGKIKTSFPVI